MSNNNSTVNSPSKNYESTILCDVVFGVTNGLLATDALGWTLTPNGSAVAWTNNFGGAIRFGQLSCTTGATAAQTIRTNAGVTYSLSYRTYVHGGAVAQNIVRLDVTDAATLAALTTVTSVDPFGGSGNFVTTTAVFTALGPVTLTFTDVSTGDTCNTDVSLAQVILSPDVVPSVKFIRHIYTDDAGVRTTADTLLNGTTPYILSGAARMCEPQAVTVAATTTYTTVDDVGCALTVPYIRRTTTGFLSTNATSVPDVTSVAFVNAAGVSTATMPVGFALGFCASFRPASVTTLCDTTPGVVNGLLSVDASSWVLTPNGSAVAWTAGNGGTLNFNGGTAVAGATASQNVATVAGKSYNITYNTYGTGTVLTAQNLIRLDVINVATGLVIATVTSADQSTTGARATSLPFVARGPVTLRFTDVSTGALGGSDTQLGSIVMTPDVAAAFPFLRHTYTDGSGVHTAVDTLLNGVTLYLPAGTVGVCPSTAVIAGTANVIPDCGSVKRVQIYTGPNILPGGTFDQSVGIGLTSVAGPGFTTGYAPSNNIFIAGANTYGFFTTNAGQVTGGDPTATPFVALGTKSAAFNVGPNLVVPLLAWVNIYMTNGETYALNADMGAIGTVTVSLALKIDAGLAAEQLVALNAPTVAGIWQNRNTAFTFTGATGFHTVGIFSNSGVAAGNDCVLDNIVMRSAASATTQATAVLDYSSVTRSVIDQVVSTAGCNDDRRDSILNAIASASVQPLAVTGAVVSTLAITAGVTAAANAAVSVTNVGTTAGTWNGVALAPNVSVSLSAYSDPVSAIYVRVPAIPYTASATAVLLITEQR